MGGGGSVVPRTVIDKKRSGQMLASWPDSHCGEAVGAVTPGQPAAVRLADRQSGSSTMTGMGANPLNGLRF
jgi:hypothetical protein